MTVQEILALDLAEIYIGNLNTVDSDLILPTCGRNGSLFSWKSYQTLFISHTGKVTRPTYGVGNRKVILEVTACYQGVTERKSFEITVLEEPADLCIKEIRTVKCTAQIGELAKLPPVVIVWTESGEAATRPVVWEAYVPLDREGILEVSGSVTGTIVPAKAHIHYQCLEERKEIQKANRCVDYVDNISSFPSGSVKLKKGSRFAAAQERMIQFLKKADVDQLLYNFRMAAGLDTKGALPMTGWDSPECKLKGHTTGHYLSGMALAYSISKEPVLKEKIDDLIDALEECQHALYQNGWKKGFLSAYGEEQFDLLEQYTKYPEIWAPYYTLDKIMCGLYDCYDLCGSQKAKKILCSMGDWVYERLSGLSKDQRDRMWSMYIAGEFGGMIGILVKLYQITGDEHYCEAARFFWNEKLFYPMSEQVDTLKDMHANQHIPQILGALAMYQVKGDERNAVIAKCFWEFVSRKHTYVIGGTGENEMFHQAGHLVDYLSEKTAESCASYNMMRLSSELFRMKPDADKMNYYERILYNHLLASMSHAEDGGTTYFMPLCPAGQKEFGTDENTCCHGTGLETRFRYVKDIYVKTKDTIYINFYIPSMVSTDQVHIEQKEAGYHVTSQYPVCEQVTVSFQIAADNAELAFRVPDWTDEYQVCINENMMDQADENGYLFIRRNWRAEDLVEVKMKYTLRCIPSPDHPEYVSLMYGPYVLAELSDDQSFQRCPELSKMQLERQGEHFKFTSDGRIFIPLADVNEQKYHVYLKRG